MQCRPGSLDGEQQRAHNEVVRKRAAVIKGMNMKRTLLLLLLAARGGAKEVGNVDVKRRAVHENIVIRALGRANPHVLVGLAGIEGADKVVFRLM